MTTYVEIRPWGNNEAVNGGCEEIVKKILGRQKGPVKGDYEFTALSFKIMPEGSDFGKIYHQVMDYPIHRVAILVNQGVDNEARRYNSIFPD